MEKKDYRASGLNVYSGLNASDNLAKFMTKAEKQRLLEKSPRRGHFPVLTFHINKEIGKPG